MFPFRLILIKNTSFLHNREPIDRWAGSQPPFGDGEAEIRMRESGRSTLKKLIFVQKK
jgi:hypothetical protein